MTVEVVVKVDGVMIIGMQTDENFENMNVKILNGVRNEDIAGLADLGMAMFQSLKEGLDNAEEGGPRESQTDEG